MSGRTWTEGDVMNALFFAVEQGGAFGVDLADEQPTEESSTTFAVEDPHGVVFLVEIHRA